MSKRIYTLTNKTPSLRGTINIGDAIASRLHRIGINTLEDLRLITPAGAYHRLQAAYPDQTLPVCYYLYSLQGALDNKDWRELAPQTKARLLEAIKHIPNKQTPGRHTPTAYKPTSN